MSLFSKFVLFIIPTLIVGALSIFVLLFITIAMNGFQESDATYGFIVYFLWALTTTILSGILSVLTTSFLVNKKQIALVKAAIISIVVFSILGAIINFIGGIVGIAVAELVRRQF